MLLLLLLNFVSGFGIYVYISHVKYQVKPYSPPWFSVACAAAISHRNHLLRFFQQNKFSEFKVIIAKGFLKLPNLHMLIKQECITSQKRGSRVFRRIANSVLNKGKPAVRPLFNDPEVLSSAPDKAKLFAKKFFWNFNLDDSGISLPVFPSRTNVKLHNIFVSP